MDSEFKKAKELFDNYQIDKSLEILIPLTESNPKMTDALLLCGKIYTKKQEYGEAINYFNKVLKYEPNNIDAQTGLKLIQNILQLKNNFYFENPYTDDGLYEFD